MAEGRAPSFQFYPADWLNDVKLQACGIYAHGLLIDLICLMHQSTKYGCLLVNGRVPDHKMIQKLLRIGSNSDKKRFEFGLQELLENGVLRLDERGVLYCKRMVEDQRLRDIRKAAGKLGGNPLLLNQGVNQTSNQKPTPSSSSSSSSSLKKEPLRGPFDENDNEVIKAISETADKVKSIYPTFNVFAFIQKNTKAHKKAMLHTLDGLIKAHDNGNRADDPWALATHILNVEEKNCNARDQEATDFKRDRKERIEGAMRRFEMSLRKPPRRKKWKEGSGQTGMTDDRYDDRGMTDD